MKIKKNHLLPLSLTGIIILLDQASKIIIEWFWPYDKEFPFQYASSTPIAQVFGNDFLQIIHARNPAIAFSIGVGWPPVIQQIIFILLPLLVLGILLWYYFKSTDFTRLQRWAVAGILGGGIGNLIDRVFRSEGVVDFIDFKFFPGFFNGDRWPTFNAADSSVVVCCILLLISIIISSILSSKKAKKKAK